MRLTLSPRLLTARSVGYPHSKLPCSVDDLGVTFGSLKWSTCQHHMLTSIQLSLLMKPQIIIKLSARFSRFTIIQHIIVDIIGQFFCTMLVVNNWPWLSMVKSVPWLWSNPPANVYSLLLNMAQSKVRWIATKNGWISHGANCKRLPEGNGNFMRIFML
jgi:hypothetical protein